MNWVWVQFDESVLPPSALSPGNYLVSSQAGQIMLPLSVEPWDELTYRLMLPEPIMPGQIYVLEVHDVVDLHGNAVPPGSMTEFHCDPD